MVAGAAMEAAAEVAAEIVAVETLLKQENEEESEGGDGSYESLPSPQQRLGNQLQNEEPQGATCNAAHPPPLSLVLGTGGGAAGGGQELTEGRDRAWIVMLQRGVVELSSVFAWLGPSQPASSAVASRANEAAGTKSVGMSRSAAVYLSAIGNTLLADSRA